MKRVISAVMGLAFVCAMAAPVLQAQGAEKTVKGEIVDVTCDMGDKHAPDAACTLACVKRGQAAGIKADGKIYTITGKYAANNNEKIVEFVQKKNVEVTGVVTEKDGKLMIDASAIKIGK